MFGAIQGFIYGAINGFPFIHFIKFYINLYTYIYIGEEKAVSPESEFLSDGVNDVAMIMMWPWEKKWKWGELNKFW